MTRFGSISFRLYLIILFISVGSVSLVLVSSYIMLYRLPQLEKQNERSVSVASEVMAARSELMLASVLEKLRLFAASSNFLSSGQVNEVIHDFLEDNEDIQALLLLDEKGITVAADIKGPSYQSGQTMIGNDLSYNPLYLDAIEYRKPVWSDKYLSLLAGDTTIGVAVPGGQYVAIAEVSIDYLLSAIRLAVGSEYLDVWVIDRLGEVVIDTERVFTPGVDNLMGLDFVQQAARENITLLDVDYNGVRYNVASSHSDFLGWIFLTRMPAGLAHPDIYSRIVDMFILVIFQGLLIVMITPLASSPVSRSMRDLAVYASELSGSKVQPPWVSQSVREINVLADNLKFLADEIRQRENSLKELNSELEDRVVQRTRELRSANRELEKSVQDLNMMRDELVEAEKLSALGALVAGVSHELNTPLGNALMAVSTVYEHHLAFTGISGEDLTVQDLESYKEHVGTGIEISQRNLEKAAELVRSFKQVAADQTSSKRRSFSLEDMLSELLLTLQPLTKRTPVSIIRKLQPGISMNSYPGILGQIITNLITNAVQHGYGSGEEGLIILSSQQLEEDEVVITIQDFGKGMSKTVSKKIFEPFFTTRQGQGGTGLGLSIAFNGARQVLGGNLEVESEPGGGTLFTLRLPANAPQLAEE
ncbi:MAG: ATP-binding protein [Spirochaetales bacterium]|nr:ATP-binding protein [Spirochaetales bacterium]